MSSHKTEGPRQRQDMGELGSWAKVGEVSGSLAWEELGGRIKEKTEKKDILKRAPLSRGLEGARPGKALPDLWRFPFRLYSRLGKKQKQEKEQSGEIRREVGLTLLPPVLDWDSWSSGHV